MYFNPKAFSNQRDKASLKLVMDALYSPTWHGQLKAVGGHCTIMTNILNWGAGCSCHSSLDWKIEEGATCQWKGRRLGEAYEYGMTAMNDALAEVGSWSVAYVGDDVELLRQLQGCVRGTWLLARDKLSSLVT